MPCIHSSGSRCDAKMNSIECGDNEWRKRGYFFLNTSQPQSSRSEKKQKRELEPPAPESGPQQETIAEAASACASGKLELKREASKTACCTAVKSGSAIQSQCTMHSIPKRSSGSSGSSSSSGSSTSSSSSGSAPPLPSCSALPAVPRHGHAVLPCWTAPLQVPVLVRCPDTPLEVSSRKRKRHDLKQILAQIEVEIDLRPYSRYRKRCIQESRDRKGCIQEIGR